MPSQVASSASTSPSVRRSESTQCTSTLPPWWIPRVVERLDHRQVGVGELVVLADQRDAHGLAWRFRRGRTSRCQSLSSGGAVPRCPKWSSTRSATPSLLELERDLVDRVDVARRHHRADRQVGEQRDLLADVLAERLLAAAHDHVRLDADPAQLLHRVLGGLGLELAGVAQERDEREVDEHAAVAAEVGVELAQRLEERQRLDVAHRAADLGDHDVHVGRLGHQPDAVLDLVGDVRDHLDGAAQVVAAALAPDHRVVDRPRRGVGGAARVHVGEALVVAQVEVGLGAVLGDEHLAVLERAHRARVDVDVGVELLDRHREPAGDEQLAQRGGRDALAECGDDAAGDEDEAGFRAALGHRRLWETECTRHLG